MVVLDAGPLGLVCQSGGRRRGRADACRAWVEGLKSTGVYIAVPEIARYEVRR